MYRIGIECESIEESDQWGLGRIITKLLKEISLRPELSKEFHFVLYFKARIPDYEYLKNPIFTKKIVRLGSLSKILGRFAPISFSLYYYILLPIKLYFEHLDLMYFPNYMLPIIFKGRSIVSLTEDAYYESHYGSNPLRYRLAYRIFCWWAAKFSTRIIAMSNTSRIKVAEVYKIPESKIVVNQLGVEIKEHSTIRCHYSSENYILYVGQAFPRRHLKETMLAFEKIAPNFGDLKLIIIGYDKYTPPIVDELREKINAKLDREAIIHQNYVSQDELEDLYSHARALIYVSFQEAFGLPPLEALAHMSLPVVADIPVAREIFGENAFFVKEAHSVSALEDAIRETLSNKDKREQILKASPDIVRLYSWSAHTDRFIKIIRSLCQNS